MSARSSAPTTCPTRRTSTRPRRTRRTRTKRFVRRPCSGTRRSVRAHLTADQYYLYRLIWNRFVASQMLAGDLRRHDGGHRGSELSLPRQRLRAEIRRLDGGLRARRGRGAHRPSTGSASPRADSRGEGAGPDAVSAEDEEGSGVLPPLAEGDRLDLKELKPEQKFTQPPPRYSESTLVKAMEENGIGRPSTYASIITVIQAREYVNKIEGRFKPTVLGRMLVDRLLEPGVRRHPRGELHARARGGSRQDRGRHRELRVHAQELLQEVREGSRDAPRS